MNTNTAATETAMIAKTRAQSTVHRLRKHADYQLVYKRGRKQFAKNIAYFYAARSEDRRSDTAGARVGLTVPKGLGKAVDRNRIKRRLREAVRRNLGLLSGPLDVVLHPRRVVMEMEFATLEREVGVIFRAVQRASESAGRRVSKLAVERGTPAVGGATV